MVIKQLCRLGLNDYIPLPIRFRTYRLACKGSNIPSSRHNQHTCPHWQVVIFARRLSMHVVQACLIRMLECYWADKSFVYKACYLLNAALKASTKTDGQTCWLLYCMPPKIPQQYALGTLQTATLIMLSYCWKYAHRQPTSNFVLTCVQVWTHLAIHKVCVCHQIASQTSPPVFQAADTLLLQG